MISALPFASLALLAAAQTPGVPHGGGACDPALSGWDCSLGGTCNASSVCACDPMFTGPTCALLNLQAPLDDQAGTCGHQFDGYHSWGGRPLLYSDSKWHTSLSFLCRHAGLGQWTTVSASAHFVSDSPAGAFSWGAEQCQGEVCTPSIIPWSHNTVFLRNDAEAARGARFQIWHVGDGVAPPSDWAPCFNFSEVGARFSLADAAAPAPRAPPRQPSPGNAAYVATSNTPSGPWARGLSNGQVPINFTGAWTGALAGNPAPLVMPDGSVNLYFTAVPCPPNSGAKASNCIAVATSTNGFEGPFEMRAARHPITYPESEDPSVFRDKRGNYHLLTNGAAAAQRGPQPAAAPLRPPPPPTHPHTPTHPLSSSAVNTCHARCAQGVECGGHAWSRDGFTFSNLTIGAFGPAITFRNGTVWRNAYVERPLVSVGADGLPVALHLGLGRRGYEDCCNWPQLFCTGAPGEVCGPTLTPPPPPPPPPPAPVRLRNGGACLTFNATTFPCSGAGAAAGCPAVMGDCASPGAAWRLAGGLVSSAAVPGVALDVDCNSAVPHTIVKALASGASELALDAGAGTVGFKGGMCLNTGQGPARKPCGPAGEVWLSNQVQLAPCGNAGTTGWVAEAA